MALCGAAPDEDTLRSIPSPVALALPVQQLMLADLSK